HQLIEAQLGDLAFGRDIEPAIATGKQNDGALRICGREQHRANPLAARSDLDDRIGASRRRSKACGRTERKEPMAHNPEPVSLHGPSLPIRRREIKGYTAGFAAAPPGAPASPCASL